MKLELLALCDYATGEPTGKLYVIGIFDRIFAKQAPISAPPCAIASRLRYEAGEQGTKNIAISFMDSDGAKVIPDISFQMNFELPPDESTVITNMVIVLPQLSLPRFGEYSIDLAVDSQPQGSVPLYIQRGVQPNLPRPYSANP